MDTTDIRMSNLFSQLGLPDDDDAIAQFIRAHQLPEDVRLHDAPFWNAGQAQFLRETWQKDNQWAMVVDGLNEALHADAVKARNGG